MTEMQQIIKKLSIEIPLPMHCDLKKYSAIRNISMKEYITSILLDQIIVEKKDENTNRTIQS